MLNRILILLVLLFVLPVAQSAQVAGIVVQVNGPMSARSSSGELRQLRVRSEIESGETLTTSAGTYALIRFIDNSELTLKPSTTTLVDRFSFEEDKPEGDTATYTLLRGGLRYVTGLLGKRNKEKFALKTPNATIGIRGTTFFLEYIVDEHDTDRSPGLDPGLHVHVSLGRISLANSAGEFRYEPGEFGFIKNSTSRPVKMFANPGIKFKPPAEFESNGSVLE